MFCRLLSFLYFCTIHQLVLTIMEKELELKKDFHSVYVGILYFDRFFGIKAGRSIWKESFVKTRKCLTYSEARKELFYLIDTVAPAMGVKVRTCLVDVMLSDDIPF